MSLILESITGKIINLQIHVHRLIKLDFLFDRLQRRNVKQVEQVYLVYTSAEFPEFNPVDACRGFPTELTPRGWPLLYRNFLRV